MHVRIMFLPEFTRTMKIEKKQADMIQTVSQEDGHSIPTAQSTIVKVIFHKSGLT